MFVLAGPFNDNHAIRGHQILDTDERPTPTQHFADWVRADPLRSDGEVYVVAAAGGGLRAAYWAAAILWEFDNASCGRFGRRTLVSRACRVVRSESRCLSRCSPTVAPACAVVGTRAAQDQQLRRRVSEVLNGDFLSPALASMLFPDAIQRFVPYPYLSRDRAWALETSSGEKGLGTRVWQYALQPAVPGRTAGDARLPSLVLNSTVVENGERIVAST